MLLIVAGLIVAVVVVFALLGWWSQRAEGTAAALVDGRLRTCASAPHCVCSDTGQTGDALHWVAPIALPPAPETERWRVIGAAIAAAGGVIKRDEPGYLHATFSSRLFRFVDDVELRTDGDRLQVRSSSRVGYSDLGANRARIEDLRARLAATFTAQPPAH